MTDIVPETEKAPEYEASVERLSDVERKLAVEIPWPQVQGRLDDAYQELGREVTLKGFRRGKVPRKMLERMFGTQVNEEVARRMVQESIAKVVGEHDIAPVSEPKVEQEAIVPGQAFRYSAVVQVVPEVEPRDYFGVEVLQRPAKVTDAEVDRALASKQHEHTQYTPIEGRNTRKGDVLVVDVMGKVGDEPISLDGRFVVLDDPPGEPLPGLAAKLTDIPVNCGDLSLEFDIVEQHADADGGSHSHTKPARLLVTVRDVKQRIVPELDDELAKDTGEAETIDELKDKLRAQLLETDEKRARSEARGRLIEKLLEMNPVPDVPPLVERQLDHMVKMQKMFLGDQLDEATLRQIMRAEAEKTVRSGLLIEAIAKAERVEVHDADLEKRLAEIASSRDQNAAKVRAEYEKEGRLEALRMSLREEKTVDLLMSKSNILIKEIPEASPDAETAGTAEDEGSAEPASKAEAEVAAQSGE